MSHDSGLSRVGQRETNNRNTSAAKGEKVKTPRKMGATGGFGKNPTKGGGIYRSLKSN